MRIYRITRSLGGIVRCMVRHVDGGKPTPPAPYRLPHATLHSPTGFECGYGGSGPADLAASILADFFAVHARTVAAAYRGKPSRKQRPATAAAAMRVIELHQDFKADVIARIKLGNGEQYEITGERVAEFVARKDNEEKSALELALDGPAKMPEIETDPEAE